MNVVAEFVIKHASQAQRSSWRKPQDCPRIVRERFVDTDLDPWSRAVPLGMVSTRNARLVELAFAGPHLAYPFFARQAGFVHEHHAVKASKVFLKHGL